MKSIFYVLAFLCSVGVCAQPGWQDFTARYFYTVLDENGKEISFKNNKNYSIMIDSVLYKSPNIPNDTLKKALPSDEGYQNQFRINDFSLTIPQKRFYDKGDKKLEIIIIHKKDTMYICQNSGTGNFLDYIDFKSKEPI